MKSIKSFFLLIFFSLIFCDFPKDESVILLNDTNFQNGLETFKYILVLVSANWCSFCTEMYPEYKKAAKILEKDNIGVAKVEGPENRKLFEKYNYSFFPLLTVFYNSNIIIPEVNNGRLTQDFVSLMRKLVFPLSKYINDEETANNFIESNEVTVVYFGKNSSDNKSNKKEKKTLNSNLINATYDLSNFNDKFITFLEVSYRFNNNFVFANIDKEELLKKYKAPKDSIAVFKYDKLIKILPEITNANDVYNFINLHGNKKFMYFNNVTAQDIFGNNKKIIFLFLIENEKKSEEIIKLFDEKLANKYIGEYQVVISYNKSNEEKSLSEYIGISESNSPKILIADCTNGIKKYLFTLEFNENNFDDFMIKIHSGKIERYYKSEEIPKEQNNKVIKVVGKSFKEQVLSVDKDVLIVFYSPNCNFSKKVRQTFSELAVNMTENNKIVIAEMDATKNDYFNISIVYFPTISIYPAKKKNSPVEYTGDRTVEDFHRFFEEEATYYVSYEEKRKMEKKKKLEERLKKEKEKKEKEQEKKISDL